MTYATDIASDTHEVEYYLKFDGVADLIATASSWPGSSGTIHAALAGIPQASGSRLDRSRSLVTPGGFTVEVANTAAVNTLFARRGGTEDTLAVAIDHDDTSVTLGSGNTGLAGTTVYLDRETITLDTHSGGGAYAVTRAVSGSNARAHAAGAIISTRPRHWMGRRAQVYAVIKATGTSDVIRTGKATSSPRYVNGVYELDFVDITTELNRPIMTGWSSVPLVFNSHTGGYPASTTFDCGDARQFSTNADSHVRVDFRDGSEIRKLAKTNVNTGAAQITISLELADLIERTGELAEADYVYSGLADGTPEVTARTVYVLEADPADAALMVLLSRYGDASNHATYDILPGVSPALDSAGDLTEKRVGAGIPSAWVDVSTWQSLHGLAPRAVFYLEEEQSLLDFLVNEVCWRLGGYLWVDQDGLITFRRYEPAVPDSAIETFTTSEILESAKTVVDDESEVLASARIHCNYDPADRQFKRTVNLAWQPTRQIFGEGRPSIEFSSKSLWVSWNHHTPKLSGNPTSESELVTMMDRIYSRTRNGVRKVSFPVPWRQSGKFVPGYVFKLTDADLPDGAGSTGITARQYEVVAVDPNLETGEVIIEAEEQPVGYLIAPAVYVSTWTAGTKTIAIDTTGAEADLFDSSPGLDFVASGTALLLDASASPPFSLSESVTISSRTATSLVLSSVPAVITPTAGDLIVMEIGANTGNTNAAGGDVLDHLFMADGSATPPTLTGTTPRVWS